MNKCCDSGRMVIDYDVIIVNVCCDSGRMVVNVIVGSVVVNLRCAVYL